MNFAKKVLAAGCLFAMLATPVTAYATPAQTSPRTGVPVVTATESTYSKVAISKVSNYVNVRTEANTNSSIVGKIYNNCAATILATVDGEGGKWYQIQSGTVTGYIKAEYFITGAEAEKIAKEIGTVYVTINTTTLRLREQASTDSKTLTLLSQDAEYIEVGEEGDFVKIEVDASLSGYVHKDYIQERVEFDCAVSLEEEQQAKDEAERLKKEAEDAIAVVNQLKAAAEGGQTTPAEQGTVTQTAPPESNTNVDTTAPTETAPAENAGSAPVTENVGVIVANPNSTGQQDVTTIAPVVENTSSAETATENSQNTDSTPAETGNTNGPGSTAGPGSTVISSTESPAGPGAPTTETTATAPASAELTSATRTAIVAYAKQFLGNPYVYGGTSLTSGADCSGFTMRIFEHFGIDTGRSSRDQAAKGKKIAISDIQPGDLLFYASGDYINHVALYIGGGQIIHASNSKTGIIISTAYYRTPYKAVTFLN